MNSKPTASSSENTVGQFPASLAPVENEPYRVKNDNPDIIICDTCGKPWGNFIKDVYTGKYRHSQCMSGITYSERKYQTE